MSYIISEIGSRVCRSYKTSFGGDDRSGYNTFESQNECQSICEAHMPLVRNCTARALNVSDVGNVPTVPSVCTPWKKYRFNEGTGLCEDYSRFGCKLNIDSYASLDECKVNCEKFDLGRMTRPIHYSYKAPFCTDPAQVT